MDSLWSPIRFSRKQAAEGDVATTDPATARRLVQPWFRTLAFAGIVGGDPWPQPICIIGHASQSAAETEQSAHPINEGFNSTLPSPGGFAVGCGPFPQGQQPQAQLQQQQSTRPGTPSAPSNAPSLVDVRRQLVQFQLGNEGRGTTINVEDCFGGVELVERALRKFDKPAPGNRAAERAGVDEGGLSVDGSRGRVRNVCFYLLLDHVCANISICIDTPLSEAQLLAICHFKADDPARERGLTLRRSAKSTARMKALAALNPSSADSSMTAPLSPLQTTTNSDLLFPDDRPARPRNYRRASTISICWASQSSKRPQTRWRTTARYLSLHPLRPSGLTRPSRLSRCAKVPNFFGQRPPSELIGAHLREFFPTADRCVLKRMSIMRASPVSAAMRPALGGDSMWSFHPVYGPCSRFSVSTVGSGGARASKRVSMTSIEPSIEPRASTELPRDEAAGATGTPRWCHRYTEGQHQH
ncbi:unnamed protein product [Peniophora sp. CBMAI 1063]|nr:unnamed protein product [Peniophora sp. CBMAI 1063]